MEQSPVPFTFWGLPWQDEEPYDVPHLDQQRQLVAVSVHHGQSFDRGPGAIVTSYDPRLVCIDVKAKDGHDRCEVRLHGPLALGRTMALRFARTLAQLDKLTAGRANGWLEAPPQCRTEDAFIQCGNILMPALRLNIGLPEATIIVSADLLTHPIVLGLWKLPMKMPVLNEVSFE